MLSIRSKKIDVVKERQKNGKEFLANNILLNLPKRFFLERKAKQKISIARERRYSAAGMFQRFFIGENI